MAHEVHNNMVCYKLISPSMFDIAASFTPNIFLVGIDSVLILVMMVVLIMLLKMVLIMLLKMVLLLRLVLMLLMSTTSSTATTTFLTFQCLSLAPCLPARQGLACSRRCNTKRNIFTKMSRNILSQNLPAF